MDHPIHRLMGVEDSFLLLILVVVSIIGSWSRVSFLGNFGLELEILLKRISFLLKELVHVFKAGIMGAQISLGCNAAKCPRMYKLLFNIDVMS